MEIRPESAMEILEGEALYKLLLQKYSKRPEGWSFTVSQSPRNGFFDALVGGPEDSWHLKLDSIFKPSPFVLGARTEQDSSKNPMTPISFGFRKIEPQQTPFLLDGSPEGMARLLAFLSSSRPVAPTMPGDFIQGPVLFTGRDQIGQATGMRQAVDRRLSEEMLKLVRRRYPNYS